MNIAHWLPGQEIIRIKNWNKCFIDTERFLRRIMIGFPALNHLNLDLREFVS